MCFGLFKDSGCDFKRSELPYFFIQNLDGVTNYLLDDIRLHEQVCMIVCN